VATKNDTAISTTLTDAIAGFLSVFGHGRISDCTHLSPLLSGAYDQFAEGFLSAGEYLLWQ
jgi:hypothetical protein